jgi:hypothetical protein
MTNPFFHPTVRTVVPAFLVTAIASGLMYYALLCGLDASGSCLQLPLQVQIVLLVFLWPWVLAVRFIGAETIAFASVIGFALSFAWVYLLACVVRLLALRLKPVPRIQEEK